MNQVFINNLVKPDSYSLINLSYPYVYEQF